MIGDLMGLGSSRLQKLFARTGVSKSINRIGFAAHSLVVFGLAVSVSGCMHQQDQLNSRLDNQSTDIGKVGAKVDALAASLEAKQDIFEDLEKRIRQERADNQVLVQDLRIEVQTLRGQIDELNHRLDLQDRSSEEIRQLVNKKSLDQVREEDSDINLYDRTLKIVLEEKDYDKAIVEFKKFLDRYPRSSLADNASFWIAEGNFLKGQYSEAILAYQKVLDNYKDSEKRCESMLKQGLSFVKLEQNDKAKPFLEETKDKCKGSSEADKAKATLKELSGS